MLSSPDRLDLEPVLSGPVARLDDAERRRAVLAGRRDDPGQVVADALRDMAPSSDRATEDRKVVDLRRPGRHPQGRTQRAPSRGTGG